MVTLLSSRFNYVFGISCRHCGMNLGVCQLKDAFIVSDICDHCKIKPSVTIAKHPDDD